MLLEVVVAGSFAAAGLALNVVERVLEIALFDGVYSTLSQFFASFMFLRIGEL